MYHIYDLYTFKNTHITLVQFNFELVRFILLIIALKSNIDSMFYIIKKYLGKKRTERFLKIKFIF